LYADICELSYVTKRKDAAEGSRTMGLEKFSQGGASLCVFPTQCYYLDDEIKEKKMGGDLSNIR
jgi:hypothetical protein